MSENILTAVTQHALDVGRFYLQNGVLKNGIPNEPERIKVRVDLPDPAPVPVPSPTPVPNPPDQGSPPRPAPVPASSGVLNSLPTLLLSALLGGSAVGLPWLVSLGINPASTRPDPTPVVSPKETVVRDGSLLQYLEDKGYHLPPDKKTK